jgi:predicted nucleic acid-binding protein
MITLDASVLIAFMNVRDAHHAAASDIFEAHCDDGFTLHAITLAEALVGHSRAGRADQVHDDLVEAGMTVAPMLSTEPLRLAEIRATTALALADCCVIAAAQTAAQPLATFDVTLASVARGLGLTVIA